MENGGGGRRLQYSAEDRTESQNLRDFLRIKEDDNSRNNSLAGLTLGAVLTGDKSPAQVQLQRSLLDIIRDDPACGRESKKSWKSFRDKLRLRRAGSAWTSSVPIPASDIPIQNNTNRMMMRRHSTRFPPMNGQNSDESSYDATQPDDPIRPAAMNSLPSNRAMLLRRNTSRIPERQSSRLVTSEFNTAEPTEEHEQPPSTEAADEGTGETEEEVGEAEAEAETEGEPPVRMSLMSLLAETDRQMGIDGSGYSMDDEEEDDDEQEESTGVGVEYNTCCICMVRHKGAAFIPCGHTFCRLCSRELWVQRGNCPLCNNFILEILDIF